MQHVCLLFNFQIVRQCCSCTNVDKSHYTLCFNIHTSNTNCISLDIGRVSKKTVSFYKFCCFVSRNDCWCNSYLQFKPISNIVCIFLQLFLLNWIAKCPCCIGLPNPFVPIPDLKTPFLMQCVKHIHILRIIVIIFTPLVYKYCIHFVESVKNNNKTIYLFVFLPLELYVLVVCF